VPFPGWLAGWLALSIAADGSGSVATGAISLALPEGIEYLFATAFGQGAAKCNFHRVFHPERIAIPSIPNGPGLPMLLPRTWRLTSCSLLPPPAFACGLATLLVSSVCCCALVLGQEGELLPVPSPPGVSSAEEVPAGESMGQQVAEIRIVGNATVPTAQIVGQLRTRTGRQFDDTIVQRDVRTLATLGWFVNVRPLYEDTPQGRIVIFEVVERPTTRYVTYLGNKKVTDKTLSKQTNLKAGGAVDPYAVEEGRRKLEEFYKGKGFNHVQVTILEGSQATDQGVVYLINEGQAQKIWNIEFVGNEFVGDSRLKTLVKSKPPLLKLFKGYVDLEMIERDVDLLTEYYRSYGFFQARVGRKLDIDDDGDWVSLKFIINEGQRYQVRSVRFLGNTIFEPEALSSQAKLQGGQPYEQAEQRRDAQWLQELYGSHGYVFADIRPETVFLEEPGEVDLLYHIEEGRQWRVGRIIVRIKGDNPHTRTQVAINRLSIRPGEILDIRELKASERRLMAAALFEVDAASNTRPKITYRIPEDAELGLASGEPTLRGQSFPRQGPPVLPPPSAGGPPAVAGPPAANAPPSYPVPTLNVPFARAVAPDPARDVELEFADFGHYLRWTESLQDRTTEPGHGPQAPAAPFGGPRPRPQESAEQNASQTVVRGQSPQQTVDSGDLFWTRPRERNTPPAHQVPNRTTTTPSAAAAAAGAYQNLQVRGQNPGAPQPAYAGLPTQPSGSSSPYSTWNQGSWSQGGAPAPTAAPVGNYRQAPGTAAPGYGGQVVRATGPSTAPIGAAGGNIQPVQYSPQLQPPAGSVSPTPLDTQGPLPGYSVDPTYPGLAPGVPYYPEGTVDVFVDAAETQTGRLMLGVGVNSDAGVVGNIVIDERNFDWRRVPTSIEDIRSGSAWRGDGQRFRADLSPGSEVNRYLLSFQEPYLFDQPVSFGLSGSYFDRRFRDWDEQRLGGRVSLGYQWVERDLSATLSYRGESVNIHDASVPTLPELAEVLGSNSLHGFRLTMINDTRDSPFLPTQGHYFEVAGEQVIGTFDYPRITTDFRKYFLVHERPDHSGRHVISASTSIGYTGTNTPIYEHFFAGGFATFRGFDFRGASPVDTATNVQVGGEFQWLNSVQYLFPITADEMLHGVVFCDFGTVERKVEIKDFRVAPGVGLRITVPAMGPAPIALDFAWAATHADFDDREVFTFSLGFSR
jgi:outer membrane protein insertion porin family